jgi:hypothetical protein
LSLEVENYVYLKLAPRFIGPFKITEEREEEFNAEFLNFFLFHLNLGDEIQFKGVGLSHPKISNFGM